MHFIIKWNGSCKLFEICVSFKNAIATLLLEKNSVNIGLSDSLTRVEDFVSYLIRGKLFH